MAELKVRPISNWPWPRRGGQKRAPFKANWQRTVQDLDRELHHLGASYCILEIAVQEDEIRLDGWIRAGARPSNPGVIVSCETKHGPMRYPCDTYSDWQANVRAIVLSLAALRAVDRYGVTGRGEQYKGFRALPEPPPAANGKMTREEAAQFMGQHGGYTSSVILGSENVRIDAYRRSAMKLHPDNKTTGDEELFKKLQKAKKALEF